MSRKINTNYNEKIVVLGRFALPPVVGETVYKKNIFGVPPSKYEVLKINVKTVKMRRLCSGEVITIKLKEGHNGNVFTKEGEPLFDISRDVWAKEKLK